MNYRVGAVGAITQGQIDALVSEAAAALPDTDLGWSWAFDGTRIDLCAELPPVPHPTHRGALLATGAVLLNLRALIRGLGVHSSVRLQPDPNRADLVATIRLEGPRAVTDQDRSLVSAVLAGPRERGVVGNTTSPAALIVAVRKAAKLEQAWLAVQPLTSVFGAINGAGEQSAGTALIIGTVLDGLGAQLQAGQAAQRVVLTAAMMDQPVSPLRIVLQSNGNRRAVRELIGGGLWPQAVFGLPTNGQRSLDNGIARAD